MAIRIIAINVITKTLHFVHLHPSPPTPPVLFPLSSSFLSFISSSTVRFNLVSLSSCLS